MNAVLKQFSAADPTISQDVVVEDGAWRAACNRAQTYRLFELPAPSVAAGTLGYRARLKTAGLTGRAYLEMWCRFPGRGEFFSRDLAHALTGSNDWASCEAPFFLKPGEQPDLIRLNLVVAATGWLFKKAVTGQVWIKDIELVFQPAPTAR